MAGTSGVSLRWGGFDQALENALNTLGAKRQDLMETVGEALVSSTVQRFQDGQGPDGKDWQPSKRAAASNGKTLVESARLRNSIDYAATRDCVHVGSNLVYSRIHQMGGKAGRGRAVSITARPYLGFSDEDKAEIQAILADFLDDAFRK